MANRFDLDLFTPYRLARAAQAVSEDFARVYRARFGLSVAEWRVLAHVNNTGSQENGEASGVSVRDVEARVGLDKSKVSRAAARLEARGLLSKCPSNTDRRLVALALTSAGRAMMAELLPLAQAYQLQLAEKLGGEFERFDAVLEQLVESFPPDDERQTGKVHRPKATEP